jgi:hypothetical protein
MKNNALYMIVLTFILHSACKKEVLNDNLSSSSLLKVMQATKPYFARSVLELKDGSVILGAVAPIDGEFDERNNLSSDYPSQLIKYNSNGDLIWQLELPEITHVLWQVIELSTGNIAAVGFDSQDNSKQVGLVIISPLGKILNQTSYINLTNYAPLENLNPVYVLELGSGDIAIATVTTNVNSAIFATRLVIFSPLLNKSFDRVYAPDPIVKARYHKQVSIEEDNSGNVLLHGNIGSNTNDSIGSYASTLKLSAGSYDPVYHQLFEGNQPFSTSNGVLSSADQLVWASCGPAAADSLFNSRFNQRNQELFLIGPKITVWKTDGDSSNTQKLEVSGFQRNGFVNKVIHTSDGGFMLLGTCNINANQQISSEYQIMMIKLSEDFKLQWMQFPKTNSQSVASDIVETASGYLVSATHLSLGEESRPIVFKTNKNGIIN